MKLYTILIILLFLCSDIFFGQNPPEVVNDSYTTEQDVNLNVDADEGLLQNDTDPDGDSLVIIGFNIN
ncbi:MAG: Ig-like domain-containing protein, partial [Psychroflexus sp.]|nr:Ig-like domain-containing protein [Psychroflexus sp.]MDR9448757.1 Ig-like domain-containing protein [Psychroflexus sp.]